MNLFCKAGGLFAIGMLALACNTSSTKDEEKQGPAQVLEGSVKHVQYGSCDTVKNSGIYVKLDLWQADSASVFGKSLADMLQQKAIKKINSFGDSALIAGKPAALKTVKGAFEVFENNYKSFKKSYPDAPGCWMMELTGDTIMTTPKVLCYELFDVSFVGGAHPNSFRSFHVFNLKSGEEMEMERFVTDSTALLKLVEKEFRKIEKLPADADLEKSGYFLLDHQFALPVSYVFTREGIRFCYNPYEIAPYARGAIDFTIPYAELKNCVDTSDIF